MGKQSAAKVVANVNANARPAQIDAFPGPTRVDGAQDNIEPTQADWGAQPPMPHHAPQSSPSPWNIQGGPSVQQTMAPAYQSAPPSHQSQSEAYSTPAAGQPTFSPVNNQLLPPPDRGVSPVPHPDNTSSPTFWQGGGTAGRRSVQVGFSVAGLCVLLAGLLLTFVYFMANSPTNQASLQADSGGDAGHAQVQTIPIAPPTVPPASTPTPTYPGQQYIDSAQTASAIDTTYVQPLQVTSTFKVNQRIYVTLKVHTGGQSGAMCLHWLLNDQELFKLYGLAIPGDTPTAYSYATYGSSGAGTVEIYWASTPECTDGILAQKVSFTVSG